MSGLPEPRDLTRWNRASKSRVQYVDGDAATWLEELRLKFLALFLRGAPMEVRDPDYWRLLFSRPPSEWPNPARLADLRDDKLVWRDLWRAAPDEPETTARRNARLLADYGATHDDQTIEIARAFARALHVLLGHLEAYANEGYLRTATQWDNVRKLAALVDYTPRPPASASTEVALLAKAGVTLAEVERGLAFRYAPPDGGKPLVFETLRDVTVDAALNAARARNWDRNETTLPGSGAVEWVVASGEPKLAAGALVALVEEEGSQAEGHIVASVAGDPETGPLTIELADPLGAGRKRCTTLLLAGAEGPRTPRMGAAGEDDKTFDTGGEVVLAPGQMLYFEVEGAGVYAFVEAVDGTLVRLSVSVEAEEIEAKILQAYEADADGIVRLTPDIDTLRFVEDGEIRSKPVTDDDKRIFEVDGSDEALLVEIDLGAGRRGFGPPGAGALGRRLRKRKGWLPALPGVDRESGRTLVFDGKMPPDLGAASWMVARSLDDGAMTPLQVAGVRQDEGRFTVTFATRAADLVADHTFYGPFKVVLRPKDWDRSPATAIDGGGAVDLVGLAPATARLLKPGRRLLIEDERDPQQDAAVLATIAAVSHGLSGDVTRVALEGGRPAGAWPAGWTLFRGNVVGLGHGETKGSTVLGSGNGELPQQSFHVEIDDISYEPEATAPSGVAPAISVSVDGMLWSRVERRGEAGDGAAAFLARRREDRTLDLTFLRRLPTGTNNVKLESHRAGVGEAGNGVPPFAFDKPAKPHPKVARVRQPFVTAGGADAEPVSTIRTQAPRELKALDRAVTVEDFATVAAAQSGVWQARADGPFPAGRGKRVRVTVVPVGGIASPSTLEDIRKAIAVRALPGVRPEVALFEAVPVLVTAKVRVDSARYDPEEVRLAVIAEVAARFALEQRRIGAGLYLSELVAAVERVVGVETAQVAMSLRPDAPAPRRRVPEAEPGQPPPKLRALFAKPDQAIFVAGETDVGAVPEVVA